MSFSFKVRDTTQEPCGRLSFMKEPKSTRGLVHQAICNLNITLPIYAKESESDQEQEEEIGMTSEKNPQDEQERMEERLAYIADHLGFSWTGNWCHPGFPQRQPFKDLFFLSFVFLEEDYTESCKEKSDCNS